MKLISNEASAESVKEMAKLSQVTLTDVARAAGLSVGGASYALRGHASIPGATVERVRRVAAELGYRPDSRISSLMATIRRRRPLVERETLAFVWINTPRRTEKLPAHLRYYAEEIVKGARARAVQLGCTLEEHWLDEREMRPNRLNQILRARGIAGVVLSPAASDHAISVSWDWSPFACAIIGTTECTPLLHRAAHDHYRSGWMTLDRLRREGCERPAALLSSSVQERIHRTQLAAFLANHPRPGLAPRLVRYTTPEHPEELKRWTGRDSPDALIVGWQIDQRTAQALRAAVPTARRVVTLDWQPRGVLPGVDPINEAIAANAVDLVMAQLHRNERGLPARSSTLLLEGVWREGRPKAQGGGKAHEAVSSTL